MPLVTYKPSPGTHAVLPITLWTTCSLILALCYLQTIYFISFLARPCWTSPREFPPFQHSIEHAERLTVDIILSIVPFARYHSPPPHQPLLHREPFAPSSSNIRRQDNQPWHHWTRDPSSTSSSSPAQWKPPPSPHSLHAQKQASPSTMPENGAPSPSQQGINASRLLAPKEENSERSDQEDDFQDAQLSIPRALPSAAVYKNARPGSKSPAISLLSLEGPRDLAAAKRALEPRTAAAEGARQVRSKFGGRQKCHSTESYPGKFPVSEGMEFSELATAEYAFREKGTTTVRPFSDY
ncbi:hypothetical protein N7470_000345 [Penicillium chermesinum]|nr:hypothetical protein N7470_000345 [Penicillium chermesinum]